MIIFDSVKKAKVELEPIVAGKVSIYVCGPTVYDDAHLGHARSSLSFDILSRTLRALGYKVTLCKNFTDIDDKIIKKMQQSGKILEEITNFYIKRYLEDMEALGVQKADIEPKATESLGDIENIIKNLLENNFAYKISTGDIYFDTTKDNLYGSLSGKVNLEDTLNRVEHHGEKKNPKDFVLWKASKRDDIISFDTSIGNGRPGWHIECSAMIDKHFLGDGKYSIDIHGGGADLLFPHHENEATQSRCAFGHELAKYWMHNGFVQINGEKMSKSLGNSFFIKDALTHYDGEILRFYLISVHYRNDFNFNEEDLLMSKKRLDKLYRLKKRVTPTSSSTPNQTFKAKLLEAMSDDMNISLTLSYIDEMISSSNEILDKEPKNKFIKKEILANIEFISHLLGIGAKEPFSYFQIGVDEDLKIKIDELIESRTQAKKEKNFKLSDEIRDELILKGIAIMDTVNGTVWEKL